jgi:phenylalanyl-tRNA synthetase beta chain
MIAVRTHGVYGQRAIPQLMQLRVWQFCRLALRLQAAMNISMSWMNQYLEPQASAAEQAELLTRAGFPLEHCEEVSLPGGTPPTDVCQDIELTSNRGDCLCHIGLAREIVAVSAGARTLKLPASKAPKATGPHVNTVARVTNDESELCPLYTARVIRGVKVQPSPAWLANRLLARGDIPRNNIVDASNFVLFEYGQPTHVFDLKKLAGPEIIIRKAKRDEPFLPIGEGAAEVKLRDSDLVIADAKKAVAIAGVKGGALTAVSNDTVDILIEAATFAPSAVRSASRGLGIASDSSYRFERGVHPGQIEIAANRLVELILELCGGTLCEGVIAAGQPVSPRRNVSMRCDRCRKVLGIPIQDEQMRACLERLGFEPQLRKGVIECTVPHVRLDIEREIDLIEEVARIHGLDKIPIADAIEVRVAPSEPAELAKRAVNDALMGMGYVECVTHSLVSEAAGGAFLPPGMETLRVADERAKAAPLLRPSIIPSLLRVAALNRDHGVDEINLFETASTFARHGQSHLERVNLAIVHSATNPEEGIRLMRGVIDRLAQLLLGPTVQIEVDPITEFNWLEPGASVRVNGDMLGTFGVLGERVLNMVGLGGTFIAAELGAPALYHRYPPEVSARELPAFPSIERDLSAIIEDRVPWIEVKSALHTLNLQHVEAIEFVTTYRGKQVGAGKKSLTLRARFRAADRTLKHDEVDAQMNAVVDALQSKFKAEIRN